MNIYQKIAIYALIAIIGVPTIAMGSSFTVSLIQGKTPTEAVQAIAEQLDSVTGRVSSLESKQAKLEADVTKNISEVEQLKSENATLKAQANENTTITVEQISASAPAPQQKSAECVSALSRQDALKKQQADFMDNPKNYIESVLGAFSYSSSDLSEGQKVLEDSARNQSEMKVSNEYRNSLKQQLSEIQGQISTICK